MKYLVLILSLLFIGCGERVKYVYIKSPCPKLETYDINKTKFKHYNIHIKIKDINKTGEIK